MDGSIAGTRILIVGKVSNRLTKVKMNTMILDLTRRYHDEIKFISTHSHTKKNSKFYVQIMATKGDKA